MGRKKHPFYRLIVTDSRNRRDGAYIANLGYYNPFAEPYEAKLHDDEIIAWLKKGATTSDTARSLMKNEGVLLRYDLQRQGLDQAEIDTKVANWKIDSANRGDVRIKAKAQAEAETARKAKQELEKKVAAEAEAAAAAAAAEAAAATAQAEAEAAAAAESDEAPVEDADPKPDEG